MQAKNRKLGWHRSTMIERLRFIINKCPMRVGVSTHANITELQASRFVAHERSHCEPDYLWMNDAEGRFVVVNRALAPDSGRAKTSDTIGIADFDLHAPEAAQHFRAYEQQILISRQPMIGAEESAINAFRVTKWLLTTTTREFGLIGIARVITARKLAYVMRDGTTHIIEMIATNATSLDASDNQCNNSRTCSVEGHGLQMTSSMGIANYLMTDWMPILFPANADAAIYRAREMGWDDLQF
jgi:hypothetical protein